MTIDKKSIGENWPKCYDRLNVREREILGMFLGKGHSPREFSTAEISAEFQTSEGNIRRIIRNSAKKLREC